MTYIVRTPTENWSSQGIETIYNDCHAAEMFLDNPRIVSQKYRKFLQSESGAIIEKMMDVIMDEGYVRMQYGSQELVLHWQDAPDWLAKFLQHVGTVFTRDGEFEIRKKKLETTMGVGVETSARAEATLPKPTACRYEEKIEILSARAEATLPKPTECWNEDKIEILSAATLPKPTECWNEDKIKILFSICTRAMHLFENCSMQSENYRQCLQRGRDAIIENMMEFIMNTGYFKMQYGSSHYVLYWRDAPQGLARFLQHLEVVFIGNEEVKIRKKRAAGLVVAVAAEVFSRSTILSVAQAAIYDMLKEGLTYVYEELTNNDQRKMPPIAVLVGLVEAPEPRLKCGILKTYGEMKEEHFARNLSDGDQKFYLEFLQGKRIFNEKWAEEDVPYELTGEAKVMLCMHLWSLMRYAGFSKSDKIWKVISKAWPECVSWGTSCGKFWRILGPESDLRGPESNLRVKAKTNGLRTILDAYKDMQKYFLENYKQLNLELEYYPSAYDYPREYDPIRSSP